MNLLADESVDRPVVLRLRDEGHDTMYVAELSPSISDDEVLAQANDRGALLLTADKDFGELVFRHGRVHAGVVLLRLDGLPLADKADIVATVLQQRGAELPGALTVISPGVVSIRRPKPPDKSP
jgi:predicted nuclease of predicted toxin-antitoxin system